MCAIKILENKTPARLSLTLIVLTHNEEVHISRCLRSVADLAEQIYVVDSFSTDTTCQVAESLGATVVQRKFINQADQLNWALDTLPISTDWVLRLDADEYVERELSIELVNKLPQLSENIAGCFLNRKVFFQGRWIKHGGFNPLWVLRLWRNKAANCEQRWMDEHMVVKHGETIKLTNSFVDDNIKGFSFWLEKVNGYATREAIEILNQKYNLLNADNSLFTMKSSQVTRKRFYKQGIYLALPPVFRAFVYFIFRYFFQLGFLDGRLGSIFHVAQGLIYRLLVDIKVVEIELRSGGDVRKMIEILRLQHHINLSTASNNAP